MPAKGDGSSLMEGSKFRRININFLGNFEFSVKYGKQTNVPRLNFLSKRYKQQKASRKET